MANGNSQIIVNGYAFYTSQDAALAETERKKVEYLKSHIKGADPEKILAVYKKAINDRLFKTPIGYDFLKEMQSFLVEQCDYNEGEVPPIQLYIEFDKQLGGNYQMRRPRIETTRPKETEKVPALFVSIILNIALVIAVIAMFVITLKSDNPNILNYETNLVDKYSYWEQELTDKQQQLRDKEKELTLREELISKQENQK